MMCLIISEGALEILQYIKQEGSANFKHLRNLKNLRTGKTFSPNTISARLKELTDYGALVAAVERKDGRNTISYRLTDAGGKSLALADKFEIELKQVLKKRTKA